ncbi:hypothetical protein AURDEDRAFT_175515 [Auricularia subglabra TFB-10046 SS5]|uniref:Uncharacterized protein n=1 Tax=Auricularia subglabra (strain TFB-10046 / SS5) TaxID=717982 RepID=J0CXF0_AURST|nr:hypothetical protein AURDEDRAFT_175515 [Auricularia subglabra TFB-10046 SS5]
MGTPAHGMVWDALLVVAVRRTAIVGGNGHRNSEKQYLGLKCLNQGFAFRGAAAIRGSGTNTRPLAQRPAAGGPPRPPLRPHGPVCKTPDSRPPRFRSALLAPPPPASTARFCSPPPCSQYSLDHRVCGRLVIIAMEVLLLRPAHAEGLPPTHLRPRVLRETILPRLAPSIHIASSQNRTLHLHRLGGPTQRWRAPRAANPAHGARHRSRAADPARGRLSAAASDRASAHGLDVDLQRGMHNPIPRITFSPADQSPVGILSTVAADPAPVRATSLDPTDKSRNLCTALPGLPEKIEATHVASRAIQPSRIASDSRLTSPSSWQSHAADAVWHRLKRRGRVST